MDYILKTVGDLYFYNTKENLIDVIRVEEPKELTPTIHYLTLDNRVFIGAIVLEEETEIPLMGYFEVPKNIEDKVMKLLFTNVMGFNVNPDYTAFGLLKDYK